MRELARKRLQDNVQQSLKYLMLVFNDFFILALIFLFGALMFWYAQSMKTMPVGLWFYRPIVGLVLCLPLLVGKLVTLFKPADLQFLLAQDEALQDYLKPLFVYSLIVPMLVLLLLAGILFPFAIIKAQILTLNYALAVFAVLLAKILQLKVEEYNLYANRKFSSMWVTLFMVIGLTTGLTAPIITYALIAVLATIAKPKNVPLVDWQYAVDQEEERKNRVYSAFSMFTDVKERQVTVKRRKYLDFLLPKSTHALIGENPNRFLYRRSLLRNPEYLNLLVRMTAFAVLISWLVQNSLWALGLSALVIFLTVYQLLPLASGFDDNVMYRIYPIDQTGRGLDLMHVLTLALLLQWLIISLFWLFILPVNLHWWQSIGCLAIWSWAIAGLYLPAKIKKEKTQK